jgi:transaldolase
MRILKNSGRLMIKFSPGGETGRKIPGRSSELIHIAYEEGCRICSQLKRRESAINSDGKIPVFSRWAQKIKEGRIAPDTLLSLAGLASFKADQEMLDQRILGIIG